METNNKLREALDRLATASEGFLRTHSAKFYVDTTEALDKAKAALAEPVRNCEVGTAEEQIARFDAFCDAHKYVGDDGTNWCSTTCPCYNTINCGVKWAQLPYEEGGAK